MTESFTPGTGHKAFLHWYSCLSRRPISAAITWADLPLLIHSVTACCLKLRSNFLRGLISRTTGSFIVRSILSPLIRVRHFEAATSRPDWLLCSVRSFSNERNHKGLDHRY